MSYLTDKAVSIIAKEVGVLACALFVMSASEVISRTWGLKGSDEKQVVGASCFLSMLC